MYKLLTLGLMVFSCTVNAQSQLGNTRYALETTFNDTAVVYEESNGVLKLNYVTNDLTFSTTLNQLTTGNKNIDSLLLNEAKINFDFTANLEQGLFGLIKQENDDTYHTIIGTITINNISYTAQAQIRVNNFGDKSNTSKALFDFKLQFNPKKIIIPILSNYFTNDALIQINDGRINQY